MDIDSISPDLRNAAVNAPRVHLERPATRYLLSGLSRLLPGAKVRNVERRVLKGQRLRLHIPLATSGAALLWLHGGGFILGNAAHDDRFCAETASHTGAVVASVDYRLATKERFPAALDDSRAAYQWLRRNGNTLGIDTRRIAVGGQSAGAGIAACLAQRLRDENMPVRAQWLFCPMLDDRTALDQELDHVNHFVWNNRMNRAGWRTYLGSALGASRIPPYASAARREDLSGLAPTWMYASSTELFYEEAERYALRLERSGVSTIFVRIDAAPHAFERLAPHTDLARSLVEDSREWLLNSL